MLETHIVAQKTEPYTFYDLESVIDRDTYIELMANWPSQDTIDWLFAPGQQEKGLKMTLHANRDNTKGRFFEFLDKTPVWKKFYDYIQSDAFLEWAAGLFPEIEGRDFERRFEFSHIPANGGNITPHPDTPNKEYTLCIYMPNVPWDESWGGDFQVLQHREDPKGDFNKKASVKLWEECDVDYLVPFLPNRAMIMKRCPWSLHAVPPMTGPEGLFRTSLTINLVTK